MTKNYIIGLDLGINNVGYSVIDGDGKKIIKTGVRLYSPANKASDRREFRNSRRRRKRKENRVQESLNLFKTISFPNSITTDTNLLQKRIKGLQEQITQQDIVNITCYFVAHRGYIPYGDEPAKIDLHGEYPCKYYQKLFEENGKYRALDETVNNYDLKRELNDILSKQASFYPELKKIIDSEKGLLWIFGRKRKFWEGPGSPSSFTPFGRFKNEDDAREYFELKALGKEKYLFEDLIGHCEIFPNEKCVPKCNVFAEQFNLLNDFINIRITNSDNIKKQDYVSAFDNDTYKLTTMALNDIIKYCMDSDAKSLSYNKVLKDALGLNISDIRGYRIDKNKKPLFSLMKAFRYVKRIYLENDIDMSWLILDQYKNYNVLMNLLAVSPGIVETERMISSIHHCDAKELNAIKEIKNKLDRDNFFQYHALSEKALKIAINDMITNCLNFMQASRKFDYGKAARENLVKNYGNGEGHLLMTSKYIDDIVASPQVKKTLRQSIRVINAIIKEQGCYPSVIAIESTKDMNGDNQKKAIERYQKIQESLRSKAREYIEKNIGEDKVTENLIEKIMLYFEINSECPYCGNHIPINDILNGNAQTEHILPLSQSSDDSQDNKTIACDNCNQRGKKNKTPYEFLSPVEFDKFVSRVSQMKISDKKRENFLTTEDVNKYQIRFFNRNLRDTAYATKELVSQVQLFNLYLKENLNDTQILTLSTPGQLTYKVRSDWKLDKDRNEEYHHAVDATIVAGIATTKIGREIIKLQNDSQYLLLNKETLKEIPKLINQTFPTNIKPEILKIKSMDDIFVSRQVNKDANASLSNANICSYVKKEDKYYMINQIDDIYAPDLIKDDKKKNKVDLLFDENDKTSILLCQEKDPHLFSYLRDIYNKYQQDHTNPFLNYCYEMMKDGTEKFNYLKHGIKTPSKGGKGILVKKLRYMTSATDPFLLEKKNINKKDTTLIGLDTVSIYCTRLYWDLDKNKIIFMPIYTPCVDFNTKKINENHSLYKLYYKKCIEGKNVEFITELFNGNYIEIEKPDGTILKDYVKTYHKISKSIECRSGKYLSSKDKFTLYDVDILGNKYKRLTWPLK